MKSRTLRASVATGAIGYDIRKGEKLVCKWYNVPGGANAAVTITKRWCAGASPNPQACPVYADGFEISLISDDPSTDVALLAADVASLGAFGPASQPELADHA